MLDRLRIPGLGGWGDDPLWATFYDWTVEHPQAGGMLWKAGIGSDLRRLYSATAEIGRQPAGSSVLDIPVGGGVALRSLRPGQGVRYVAADISQAMLDRTMRVALERHVVAQVEPVIADVGSLPFADGEFDLVVSFTGLHCFPDPHLAVLEMARVLHPGGILTGSALLEDTGLRYLPMRGVGRLAGLLGPGATTTDVRSWLAEAGLEDVTLELSGAMGTSAGARSRGRFPRRPGNRHDGSSIAVAHRRRRRTAGSSDPRPYDETDPPAERESMSTERRPRSDARTRSSWPWPPCSPRTWPVGCWPSRPG